MKTQGRSGSSPHVIRTFGDPVLKTKCPDITNVDAALVKLAEDMIVTMNAAAGVGLAGPQVGVQKRLFVYDDGSGPRVMLNARIVESSGEWTFEEGCLSVPEMYFSITRPNKVVVEGLDLDGNEVRLKANEYLGRIFQHEIDHLDGKLLLDRLESDERKSALRTLRERSYKLS